MSDPVYLKADHLRFTTLKWNKTQWFNSIEIHREDASISFFIWMNPKAKPLHVYKADLCKHLRELHYKIIAVWICSRGKDSNMEVCLKINAPPALITIVSYGYSFSISVTGVVRNNSAAGTWRHFSYLPEKFFSYWSVNVWKKWDIIASANMENSAGNLNKDKRVCDIASFVKSYDFRKWGQRFTLDVFRYLVNDEYINQVYDTCKYLSRYKPNDEKVGDESDVIDVCFNDYAMRCLYSPEYRERGGRTAIEFIYRDSLDCSQGFVRANRFASKCIMRKQYYSSRKQ